MSYSSLPKWLHDGLAAIAGGILVSAFVGLALVTGVLFATGHWGFANAAAFLWVFGMGVWWGLL